MKRKGVDFKEIHDARAVRILVNDVKDCYAVLGVVHNLWVPIPKEFDDYIARPKGNDYRSLHTAVIGPEEKVVEVQIRTHEMHRHSEMGVAAHWRYKEGAKRDARYEEKIAWLRQILEWKNDVEDAGELAEHFKSRAVSGLGLCIDAARAGSLLYPRALRRWILRTMCTPILATTAVAQKLMASWFHLTIRLQNAQRVEIISGKQGGPSRDWLNPALGYLKSHRARSKVRQWFSGQEREDSLAQGRALVEKELQRHGMTALGLDKLAGEFKFTKLDAFLAAVARGDISSRQLGAVLSGETEAVAVNWYDGCRFGATDYQKIHPTTKRRHTHRRCRQTAHGIGKMLQACSTRSHHRLCHTWTRHHDTSSGVRQFVAAV